MIKFLKGLSLVLTMICLVLLTLLETNAKSLWSDDTNLYSDRKAHKKGDIVTIIIVENATAQNEVSNDRSKSVSIGGYSEPAESNTGTSQNASKKTVFNSLAKLIPLFGASIKGSSEYKGEGKSTRKGLLNARITTVVDEVLPNGNLVLKGIKKVKINNEVQEIEISGIVRPDDITAENSVYSYYVANAEVRYNGKFSFSDEKRKGFLTRFVEKITGLLF